MSDGVATASSATDHSTSELLSDVRTQATRLIRDEMAMARLELRQSAKLAGVGSGLVGAAALFGFLGTATTVVVMIVALDLVLPLWAAALIVAGLLLLGAGVFGLVGRLVLRRVSRPERALSNVKRDLDAIRRGHVGPTT